MRAARDEFGLFQVVDDGAERLTPRRKAINGADHAGNTRAEKLAQLTRMEAHRMGNGDIRVGVYFLHPAYLIEALDAHPSLPASQVPVRTVTRPEMLEAKAAREKPWSVLTDDEMRIREEYIRIVMGEP